GREPFGVAAAMALDDDSVETKEHAAVDVAGIHLFAQRREGIACQKIAELRLPALPHRPLEQLGELTRRALRRLDRDVAGKPFRHDHVDHALADLAPLDETDVFEIRQTCLAQNAAGVAHLLQSLDLLDADIQQRDLGAFMLENDSRQRAAHHGQVDDVLRIGTDGSPYIQYDRLTSEGRPESGDRWALKSRHGLESELRH